MSVRNSSFVTSKPSSIQHRPILCARSNARTTISVNAFLAVQPPEQIRKFAPLKSGRVRRSFIREHVEVVDERAHNATRWRFTAGKLAGRCMTSPPGDSFQTVVRSVSGAPCARSP